MWFTRFADELARFLTDAENCAETCETYLAGLDDGELNRAVHVLAAPAAVARVLIELIDQPPELVLAAARLCHDLTAQAADDLGGPPEVIGALRAVAASAGDLVEAAG